jgi:hypothetical protein
MAIHYGGSIQTFPKKPSSGIMTKSHLDGSVQTTSQSQLQGQRITVEPFEA